MVSLNQSELMINLEEKDNGIKVINHLIDEAKN